MTGLLAHVEESIRARQLLRRGQKVVVAVSGGADSMVLFHLLHQLALQHRWQLIVAHFNHQLRGRSSDADERLVCKTAKSLGLTCIGGRGQVKARARQTGQSLEMAARDLRHRFLAHTARKWNCRCIALAHHADDQVELFFLRLLRGAGGEGLAGMKWRVPSPVDSRTWLIRPLLDVRRAELTAFAKEHRIAFREDASNASLVHSRNRIRHELLPLLESRYQPGLAKAVLRAMEIIGAEAEFVAAAAGDWLTARRRPDFSTLSPAVQRRCLQLQLQRLDLPADYQTIEWLREKPNCHITICPGVTVSREPDGLVQKLAAKALEFKGDERRLVLTGEGGEVVFSGLRCQWKVSPYRLLVRRSTVKRREVFDADAVGAAITLRHWQPGDRFQPIGMPEPVKLQDWFTNQKIPSSRRRELVVATTAGGEIFWVEGLRISERFKLAKRTRRRLAWRWQRA